MLDNSHFEAEADRDLMLSLIISISQEVNQYLTT